MLRTLLEAEGYEVLGTAANEQQACDWLQRNEGGWDLVTIDLLLAEGSGFAVLRRCAQSPQAGAVAVFSGFITDTVRQRCLALGASAVFPKHEAEQLRQWIRGGAARP